LKSPDATSLAEWLEYAPALSIMIGTLGIAYFAHRSPKYPASVSAPRKNSFADSAA
jgi:hypothetical protein